MFVNGDDDECLPCARTWAKHFIYLSSASCFASHFTILRTSLGKSEELRVKYGKNLEQGLHKNNSYKIIVHYFMIFFTLEYAATPTHEKRPSPGLLQLSPKLLKHKSWPSGAEQQRSHFGLAHCFCTMAPTSCLPVSNWLFLNVHSHICNNLFRTV